MVSTRQALLCLESFRKDVDRLYGNPSQDYRGRIVSRETVRHYLEHEKYRFAKILSLLPDPENPRERLLDIGTAYGFVPAVLQQETFWNSEGLELAENIPVYCAFAQDRAIPIHAGKLEQAPLPFPDGAFSAVIFSEVLEHLRLSPHRVFRELCRILVPGGCLIVTTPNFARLSNVLKLLAGKNPLEKFPDLESNNITEHLTHVREYTMSELRELLLETGFRVVRARYSGCMEKGRLRAGLTMLVPRWRGSLVILARKSEGR